MVVLAPLLDWSGFYQQDIQIKTEEKVDYQFKDKDEVIRGILDILIVQNNLWLLVIETKNAQTTVNAALAQLLFSICLMLRPISPRPLDSLQMD